MGESIPADIAAELERSDRRAYFEQRLRPALSSLLDAAAATGEVRADIDPIDLLGAVANLSSPNYGGTEQAGRMVTLLIDGLRYGAKP